MSFSFEKVGQVTTVYKADMTQMRSELKKMSKEEQAAHKETADRLDKMAAKYDQQIQGVKKLNLAVNALSPAFMAFGMGAGGIMDSLNAKISQGYRAMGDLADLLNKKWSGLNDQFNKDTPAMLRKLDEIHAKMERARSLQSNGGTGAKAVGLANTLTAWGAPIIGSNFLGGDTWGSTDAGRAQQEYGEVFRQWAAILGKVGKYNQTTQQWEAVDAPWKDPNPNSGPSNLAAVQWGQFQTDARMWGQGVFGGITGALQGVADDMKAGGYKFKPRYGARGGGGGQQAAFYYNDEEYQRFLAWQAQMGYATNAPGPDFSQIGGAPPSSADIARQRMGGKSAMGAYTQGGWTQTGKSSWGNMNTQERADKILGSEHFQTISGAMLSAQQAVIAGNMSMAQASKAMFGQIIAGYSGELWAVAMKESVLAVVHAAAQDYPGAARHAGAAVLAGAGAAALGVVANKLGGKPPQGGGKGAQGYGGFRAGAAGAGAGGPQSRTYFINEDGWSGDSWRRRAAKTRKLLDTEDRSGTGGRSSARFS